MIRRRTAAEDAACHVDGPQSGPAVATSETVRLPPVRSARELAAVVLTHARPSADTVRAHSRRETFTASVRLLAHEVRVTAADGIASLEVSSDVSERDALVLLETQLAAAHAMVARARMDRSAALPRSARDRRGEGGR